MSEEGEKSSRRLREFGIDCIERSHKRRFNKLDKAVILAAIATGESWYLSLGSWCFPFNLLSDIPPDFLNLAKNNPDLKGAVKIPIAIAAVTYIVKEVAKYYEKRKAISQLPSPDQDSSPTLPPTGQTPQR